MGETHLHTGYWEPGAGEVEDGLGEGGSKQTTRGAGSRPDTWSWEGGAKRGTRGAMGSPGVRGGDTRGTRESQG